MTLTDVEVRYAAKRAWANEAECYRPDWIEMALAHADEDEVRGAYNAALYLTPRRRMLQHWGDLITGMIAEDRTGSSTASHERTLHMPSAAERRRRALLPVSWTPR